MSTSDQPLERVLFVDDEPRVLDGLRRMLRSMRSEWEMRFVTSGADALQVIAEEPVTVLVTDMRMPDMDGSALLDAVKATSPDTVRIVLSGQCDAENVYQLMNKAHQYISKPCDAEKIRLVVARACALRDVLGNTRLQRRLSRMTTLPSPPALYTALMTELESATASLPKVGELIAGDVAMTVEVLRLVNSAWFSLNREITDTVDAVLMLGIETVKTLMLSAHVFGQLEGTDLSIADLSDHSVRVAQLARRVALAEGLDGAAASQAFTAGMMHELGLIILAVNSPDELAEITRLTAGGASLAVAERQVVEASHAEIGAYMLGLWGLPNPILEAVAFLGAPHVCPDSAFSPLSAVHVAEALVHETVSCPTPGPALDKPYLYRLGRRGRLDAWRELV